MIYELVQIGSHGGGKINRILDVSPINKNSNVVFVEPIKWHIDNLIDSMNRMFPENKFIYVNAPCSDKSGPLDLYVPDIEFFTREIEPLYIERGWVNWIDQLTSVYEDHVKDHRINIPVKKETFEAVTIMDLVNSYQITELKHLFIDTEGHDYEILSALDLTILKPSVITFEHKHIEGTNKPLGERYETLISRFESNGYSVTKKELEDTELRLI